jgi:hypothetical protein
MWQDERYKLLLLLPVERRGLRQLIYDLTSCPIREIYQALRHTRVQAIIPSFMVEGSVILTPTLQQVLFVLHVTSNTHISQSSENFWHHGTCLSQQYCIHMWLKQMRKMRSAYKILCRKSEMTRILVYHSCIWEDNINTDLKEMAPLTYKTWNIITIYFPF